ncbi:diacylglycerol/lipid kinase family protein [Ignavigranum ruoffiae]|uniref:Diacylglycerol kinase family enzyme n=1 Tax=Ignavigranum ruoffiae TaxID=89093 RepID=A0A1H8YVR8_9LACT|nr:diacylglycerol kinase family protein [Ignavigranum ruoffiae]SEP56153.1 Diacylglycerol kinase family enzyme [Ignavigranum ruoffiae]
MINRVHIICHPNSGQGQGKYILSKVLAYLDHYQIFYQVHQTTAVNQAGLMAKQIACQVDLSDNNHLLIIGGDGTLHDVVQALWEIERIIPVNYIPTGTGNDFARAWLKDQTYQDVLENMLFHPQIVNVPIFTYENHLDHHTGIILNSMGFGFDAVTNRKTGEFMATLNPFLKRLVHKLKLAYLCGLVLSLSSVPKFPLHLIIDGKSIAHKDVSIATVVNNPMLGGGIQIDNLSRADRAELVTILYHDIDFSAIKELLAKVFIHKNQDRSKHVTRYVADYLRLIIKEPIQGQVDGESFIFPEIDMTFNLATYPFILPTPRSAY